MSKSEPPDGTLDGKSDGKLRGRVHGEHDGNHDGKTAQVAAYAPRTAKVATVSHTLEHGLAERLREFAFRERISESAVIEHALIAFFAQGDDATLGARLRGLGATLRRRT